MLWMRKWGENPRCTAAVSVETVIWAKARHWETEKAVTGAGEHLPKRKSEDRLSERPHHRCPVFGGAETEIRRNIGCGELSPQPFFFVGKEAYSMADKTLNPTEQAILQAIRRLDYGTVTVTVHDGKPTLLEVSKKIKLA